MNYKQVAVVIKQKDSRRQEAARRDPAKYVKRLKENIFNSRAPEDAIKANESTTNADEPTTNDASIGTSVCVCVCVCVCECMCVCVCVYGLTILMLSG